MTIKEAEKRVEELVNQITIVNLNSQSYEVVTLGRLLNEKDNLQNLINKAKEREL